MGVANYLKILQDPLYLEIAKTNLFYLVSGVIQMLIAYYFAIILSTNLKGQSVFKSMFMVPSLISGVGIAMMFRLFLTPDGAFDQFLNWLHLSQWQGYWLGDPKRVNYSLAAISLWRNLGMSFILYYGAIQSVPKDYLEYTKLEGASLWQETKYVYLPSTMRIIKLNVILMIIGVLSVFEIPYILTGGSNGSETVVIRGMKLAFERKKYGLASSLSVILTCAIVVLSLLQRKIQGGKHANH